MKSLRPASVDPSEERTMAANHSAHLLKVWLILCDDYPTLIIHKGIYGSVCSNVAHLACGLAAVNTVYRLAAVSSAISTLWQRQHCCCGAPRPCGSRDVCPGNAATAAGGYLSRSDP